MTPEERDALAQEVAALTSATASIQETLDMISDKVDAMQAQNVRHIQSLQGDFKQAVEKRADTQEVLAYKSSELFAQAQRQGLRLSEINAQLIERIGPVCDNLSTLTEQIRGLIGLTQSPECA